MIVDHLSTRLTGGAAIAARMLHHGLLEAGVTSRFWHSNRETEVLDDPSYQPITWSANPNLPVMRIVKCLVDQTQRCILKWQLKRSLPRRLPGRELFSAARQAPPTRPDFSQLYGDILHLHWVSGLLDYPSFFAAIPDDLPIVWTMHDMNPFTGGCHYAGACEKFCVECKHCPQLARQGDRDISNRGFHTKLAALQGKNLHVVANSHWTERQARKSPILSGAKSFRTIHYGLDLTVFAPQDKNVAKQKLDLPTDAVVIGFGADHLANPRKGARELVMALSQLRTKRRVIAVTFGRGDIPRANAGTPEIRNLGFVSDPRLQATIYSAADLFVVPSLQEAFGLTGIESMACGTPVVGFDGSGITDFVRDGTTGRLARVGDAQDLARQIVWMIDDQTDREQMGRAARAVTLRDFCYTQQASKYVQLYESLLTERPANRASQRAA